MFSPRNCRRLPAAPSESPKLIARASRTSFFRHLSNPAGYRNRFLGSRRLGYPDGIDRPFIRSSMLANSRRVKGLSAGSPPRAGEVGGKCSGDLPCSGDFRSPAGSFTSPVVSTEPTSILEWRIYSCVPRYVRSVAPVKCKSHTSRLAGMYAPPASLRCRPAPEDQ